MSHDVSTRPRTSAPANAMLFVACVAIWSTNWIAITTQVRATPAITSLFWRFLLAFIVLLVAERLYRRPQQGSALPVLASAAVGLFYYFGGIGLTYIAAVSLPSSHLACLSVTVVFFSMAIKRICYGTKILASNVVGAAISAAGLVLFFLDGRGTASISLAGVMIGLASFLCVAIGAVISEHLQKKYAATSLQINRGAIGCACTLYLVAALATGTSLDVPLTLSFLLPLLYLGIICSALVFVFFIALIGRVGAEYAGYVSFIYPLAATYISYAVGETELRASMVAGSLLVVAGCVIGLKYAKLTARTAPGPRAGEGTESV